MTAKQRAKQERTLVEKAYYRTCTGIPVSIMDLSKIYAEGHKAIAEARDLDAAIRAFVETIRTDRPAAPVSP